MKVLLDNDLPRSAAPLLQSLGHDAIHVGSIGMAKADDDVIMEFAKANQQVVVTFDADFHTLLALSGATAPSVVRIRIEGLRGPAVCTIVNTVIQQFENELNTGAAVTVDIRRIRCRMLPLR